MIFLAVMLYKGTCCLSAERVIAVDFDRQQQLWRLGLGVSVIQMMFR